MTNVAQTMSSSKPFLKAFFVHIFYFVGFFPHSKEWFLQFFSGQYKYKATCFCINKKMLSSFFSVQLGALFHKNKAQGVLNPIPPYPKGSCNLCPNRKVVANAWRRKTCTSACDIQMHSRTISAWNYFHFPTLPLRPAPDLNGSLSLYF